MGTHENKAGFAGYFRSGQPFDFYLLVPCGQRGCLPTHNAASGQGAALSPLNCLWIISAPRSHGRDNPEVKEFGTEHSKGCAFNGVGFLLSRKSDRFPLGFYSCLFLPHVREKCWLGSLILSRLKGLEDKRQASLSPGPFVEEHREVEFRMKVLVLT